MSTRDKILKILEENRGTFLSGEALADQLKVSRNAIWKNMKELKARGYEIESQTNRGYMLARANSIISEQGIETFLKNAKAVASINVYDELQSTNTLALSEILANETKHGSVIVARSQTKGKGHNQTSYSSPEGGIYVSIILEPNRVKHKNPIKNFALAVSTAIANVLQVETTIGEDSSIYVGGEKISGILSEGIFDMETKEVSSYVVGVGVNPAQVLGEGNLPENYKNRLIAAIIDGILAV